MLLKLPFFAFFFSRFMLLIYVNSLQLNLSHFYFKLNLSIPKQTY